MLRSFTIENGRLVEDHADDVTTAERLARAVWIDAVAVDDTEHVELSSFLTDELPADEDVEEIESSARYFVDADGIHVHSLFVTQTEGRHQTDTVASILQPDRLITLHDEELPDFRLLRMRARAGHVEAVTPAALLVTLFDQKVENLADTIEDIHLDLQQLGQDVLEDDDADYEAAIDSLARLEDSCGKVRLCLMDTQRSIAFALRRVSLDNDDRETARQILTDVDALTSHITFLTDKINFLMDSTVSFINIEQSQIIKIFSIAAVVFLPPTLIASIYGMNFEYMPELSWKYGYPMAIGLMIAAGIAPFWYFKHKKWL
ncbi:magnesium/cobalt transporter CorA [Salinisphaera sp. USBA-960]|uniref:magnesium/cobalt transporter CorA n=1 Tax=Salinisphaera orenii TaxID=856731 RepID=UPI000DBE965B|nr:magnesium/cobalt transporter CorA [Salifodinibacter halophilus]NNC25611.1 magnesium/cobalt transporter CorA [Salifodinibacter halophilus]